MSKSLNFTNVTKKYFTVTLPDEKNTTILVGMPTKALLRELTNLKVGDMSDLNALDDLYAVCASVMSRNKGGIKITVELLEDIFDFGDIIVFLKGYMDFISEAIGRKN